MEDEMNTNKYLDNQNEPVVSLGDWFLTILICLIPLVNIIMLLIWAFGGGANPNKANFAKAALVFVLIYFLIMSFFVGHFMNYVNEMMFF
ncbi:MAG: hypothetical protein ACRCX4_00430 [Bacteroidales bacterium]